MVDAMKALFGVAVFGLVPVPPMPACDALGGSPDDRLTTTEDMRKLRLEFDANRISNDVKKNEPAPNHLDDIDTELTLDRHGG
jgi:hypothetical protein